MIMVVLLFIPLICFRTVKELFPKFLLISIENVDKETFEINYFFCLKSSLYSLITKMNTKEYVIGFEEI